VSDHAKGGRKEKIPNHHLTPGRGGKGKSRNHSFLVAPLTKGKEEKNTPAPASSFCEAGSAIRGKEGKKKKKKTYYVLNV